MSYFNVAFFLEPDARVSGSAAPHPTLYVSPDGGPSGAVAFQIDNGLSPDEQLRIAEAFLSGVQRWRDQMVEHAQRRRTAEDELTAAREEIARLKAERDGGGPE